jgi:SAM-dependent methyltransferase
MRRDWDARAAADPWHYTLLREPVDWRSESEAFVGESLDRLGCRISRAATVLEIGCGPGRLTWALARRARRVVAVDVSPRMVDVARRNLAGVDNVLLLVGDGSSLAPVRTGAVDLVYSALTLQHLPRASLVLGYLSEAARVLAPGGDLAVQLNNETPIRFLARRAANRTMWLVNLSGRRTALEHGRTWTGSRVGLAGARRVLADAGAALVAVRGEGSLACWVRAVREDGRAR